ncbi:hypothetical protein D3C71_1761790 [compost metagenome]
MQVLVSATSSKVDDLILIETTTTIGDQETTHRTGYNAEELMENRFLSGDLETRIEALRVGAEAVTVKAVELHFKTLMKILKKEPEVTDVSATPSSELQGLKADLLIVDEVAEKPLKKPRAKRNTKTTTTESK